MKSWNMHLDINSLVQSLKKSCFSLICIALIVSSLSYIVVAFCVPKSYASTTVFSLTSDNVNLMVDRYRMRTALERMNMYFSSTTMESSLCTELGKKKLPGKLEVEGLVNSNLVEVKCIANSKEKAFQLTSALRKKAPEILQKMTETYRVEALGDLDAKDIVPNSKNPAVVSILLGMIVFCLGLFVQILKHIFSGTIHNEQQAKEELDVNYLGSIPHEEHKKKQSMLVSSNLRSLDFVEAFQRCTLSFMRMMTKNNTKICVVSSLLENEGKSTVAANLALTLARNNKKVLLIDADFRKPALQKIFGLKNQPNLVDFIEGNKPAKDVVITMPYKGLYCCFSEKANGNVEELLENKNLFIMMNRLKEKIDYILIDTSPCSITEDAKVLAQKCDGLLLVSRTNMAKIGEINDKIEQLQKEDVSVLGVFVNDNYDYVSQEGKYKYSYRSEYRYEATEDLL